MIETIVNGISLFSFIGISNVILDLECFLLRTGTVRAQ